MLLRCYGRLLMGTTVLIFSSWTEFIQDFLVELQHLYLLVCAMVYSIAKLVSTEGDEKRREWHQVFSCLVVTLASLCQGTMFVWNGFALPRIEEELQAGCANCTQPGSADHNWLVGQISLLASANSIGAAAGAAVAGWAVSALPPVRLIPGLAVATGLSWVCLLAAPLPGMLAGKLVLGLAVSVQCSAVPLYISAVAPKSCTGLLLSLYSIVRNAGQVVVTTMSVLTPLSWQTLTAIFGVGPAALLLLLGPLLALPRSETSTVESRQEGLLYGMLSGTNFAMWAGHRQGETEAPSNTISKTLDNVGRIQNIIEKKKELEKKYGSSKVSTQRKKGLAITKATSFIVFFGCSALLSGACVIINYPSKLITSVYPYEAVTILSISLGIKLFGSVVSSVVTTKLGMKLPLMVSSALMAVSMLVFSVYYSFYPCTEGSTWCFLPAVNIMFFYFCFSLGIDSLFHTIVGARLPLRKRILTIPAVHVSREVLTAAQNALVPVLVDQFGHWALAALFAVFGVINTITVIVALLWLS